MGSTTPVYALPYPAESDLADVPADIQRLAQRIEAVLPNVGMPTGMGGDWYAAVAPSGFLLCDGSAVSRAAFAALFAAIGTTWGGGDGSSTFNLPDTRGRVVVGLATGGHADVAALAGNDGAALAARRPRHNHTNGLAIPNHVHAFTDPGHVHAYYQISNDPDGATNLAGPGDRIGQGATPRGNQGNVYQPVASAGTGITVGNPTTLPAIAGAIGAAGSTDAPSYVVVAKVIKT